MSPALLLTGAPGCGKTTALRQALVDYQQHPGESGSSAPVCGGFYTREFRRNGSRDGFEIVTLDGQHGWLAHVDIPGPLMVEHYGVDLTTLEQVAIPAIRAARAAGGLVIIDEIGPMETFSALFCQVVEDLLRGPGWVLGTIVQRSTPFTDKLKALPGVTLLEVHLANRETIAARILEWLER
jgi:nucleoside-triphosphatase